MSVVTNLALMTGAGDGPRVGEHLNRVLRREDARGSFQLVDDHAGGNKAIEGGVGLVAINHAGDLVLKLCQALDALERDPDPYVDMECVQLFVKEQEDSRWSQVWPAGETPTQEPRDKIVSRETAFELFSGFARSLPEDWLRRLHRMMHALYVLRRKESGPNNLLTAEAHGASEALSRILTGRGLKP